MSDQRFQGDLGEQYDPAGEDVGYGYPDPYAEVTPEQADQAMESVVDDLAERLDRRAAEQHPEYQAAAAREAAEEQAHARRAADLAAEFPELDRPENAERLIVATNNFIVDAGLADVVAKSPEQYWTLAAAIHREMTSGKSGPELSAAIRSRYFMQAISRRSEGLGAGCLPFG